MDKWEHERAREKFLRTQRDRQKKNEQELSQMLKEPARAAREKQFALDHANDSDEELLLYLKKEKMSKKNQFKRKRFIGYTYYLERFGCWEKAAEPVNKMIAEEKEASRREREEAQAKKSKEIDTGKGNAADETSMEE